MKGSIFQDAQQALGSQDIAYSNVELQKISAMAEGIKQMQDFRNIFAVSEFSADQVVLISKARIIGQFWNIPEIEMILKDLATMQLSKDRKSRQEIVNVLIGMGGKKKFVDRVKNVIKPDQEMQQ